MTTLETLLNVGIILFFCLYVLSRIIKKTIPEMFSGVWGVIRGVKRKESAQEIIESVKQGYGKGSQEWNV